MENYTTLTVYDPQTNQEKFRIIEPNGHCTGIEFDSYYVALDFCAAMNQGRLVRTADCK